MSKSLKNLLNLRKFKQGRISKFKSRKKLKFNKMTYQVHLNIYLQCIILIYHQNIWILLSLLILLKKSSYTEVVCLIINIFKLIENGSRFLMSLKIFIFFTNILSRHKDVFSTSPQVIWMVLWHLRPVFKDFSGKKEALFGRKCNLKEVFKSSVRSLLIINWLTMTP